MDVCFNNMLGVYNTRMLRAYASCAWYVRPLVLAIKHWAKRRGINDASTGTLSSYAYCILAIHFLQSQGLLPDLQDEALRSGGPRIDSVTGFDTAFCEDMEAARASIAQVRRFRLTMSRIVANCREFV